MSATLKWNEIDNVVRSPLKKILLFMLTEPTTMYRAQKSLQEGKIVESERSVYKAIYELLDLGLVIVKEEKRVGKRVSKIIETNKKMLAKAFSEETGIREDVILNTLDSFKDLVLQRGLSPSMYEKTEVKFFYISFIKLLSKIDLSILMNGLISLYVLSNKDIDEKIRLETMEKIREYGKKTDIDSKVLGDMIKLFNSLVEVLEQNEKNSK